MALSRDTDTIAGNLHFIHYELDLSSVMLANISLTTVKWNVYVNAAETMSIERAVELFS